MADDSDDKVDHNIDKSHDDIMRSELEASIRNLPKDKISVSNGSCVTCGIYAERVSSLIANPDEILGNGLCSKCWDYVLDFSSPNIKLWPDATQYETIYQARLNLS